MCLEILKNEAIISKNWYLNFKKYFKEQPAGDHLLILLVGAIVLFGLLMVYSSSYIFAQERTGDGFSFIRKQAIYALLGLGAFSIAAHIPLEKWKKTSGGLWLGAIITLLLVLIPGVGSRVGGAQRWINFGLFRVQPSEVAKLICVMMAARVLAKNQLKVLEFKPGILEPFLYHLPILILLVLQPDFGSVVLITLTTLLLIFIAGARVTYLLSGIVSVVSIFSALVLTSPYRLARVKTFLDPWQDPSGKGFQVIQSMLGLYQGSIFGQGLGNGKGKLFFLPEAHNDFIFAVIGEELGFLGITAVVLAFVFLIYRGLKISWTALQTRHDRFSFYVGCGITLMIGVQAFFNMGVVLGLLPTKGLTLPFISYGGSALMINLFEVGILYSISKANQVAPAGVSHV